MKYVLRSTYTESNHTVTEEWKCGSKEELLSAAVECLDILHNDGVPYEPKIEDVQKNFEQFNIYDKNLVDGEFKRLTDGWNAYTELAAKLAEDAYPASVAVDEATTIEAFERPEEEA